MNGYWNELPPRPGWRSTNTILTRPCVGVLNGGYDNVNGDLILSVNQIIGEQQKYLVLSLLGSGTFGQVAKCLDVCSKDLVAIKIIKSQPAYYQQSLMEIELLNALYINYNEKQRSAIVQVYDTFVYVDHLCIVMELLDINLYELLKLGNCTGLPHILVRRIVEQLLNALVIFSEQGIVHGDLKPENIAIKEKSTMHVKIIDFGSGFFVGGNVQTYIQSRFYRAPEVILIHPYTSAIDMWSLGCIAFELYYGVPLFPGASNYDQLCKIIELAGNVPYVVLSASRSRREYYNESPTGHVLKTHAEYNRDKGCKTEQRKHFSETSLEQLIYNAKPRGDDDVLLSKSFVDFLRKLLNLDPLQRWDAATACNHPYICGDSKVNRSTNSLSSVQNTEFKQSVPVSRNVNFSFHLKEWQ